MVRIWCAQLVLSILNVQLSTAATVMTSFNPNHLVIGRRLDGHVFQTIVKVSAKQCFTECFRRPKCASFNYRRMYKLCELNGNTINSNSQIIIAAVGYVYGHVQVVF